MYHKLQTKLRISCTHWLLWQFVSIIQRLFNKPHCDDNILEYYSCMPLIHPKEQPVLIFFPFRSSKAISLHDSHATMREHPALGFNFDKWVLPNPRPLVLITSLKCYSKSSLPKESLWVSSKIRPTWFISSWLCFKWHPFHFFHY